MVPDGTGGRMVGIVAVEDISRGSVILDIPAHCVISKRTAHVAGFKNVSDLVENFALQSSVTGKLLMCGTLLSM